MKTLILLVVVTLYVATAQGTAILDVATAQGIAILDAVVTSQGVAILDVVATAQGSYRCSIYLTPVKYGDATAR